MTKKKKPSTNPNEVSALNKEETWDNMKENSKNRYLTLISKLNDNDISVMQFLQMSRAEYNAKTGSNVKTEGSFKVYKSKVKTVYQSEVRHKQVEIKYKEKFRKNNISPDKVIEKIKDIHYTIHKLDFKTISKEQTKYVNCVNDLINRFGITRNEGKDLMDYYIRTPKNKLETEQYDFLKDFYY